MKPASIGALFLALSASHQIAEAQTPISPCKFYEDLIAAAPEDFAPYRDQEIRPGIYVAKLHPAQFPICATTARSAEASLLCYGVPGQETIVRPIYEIEQRRLLSCLQRWKKAPLLETDDPQIEMVEGVRFIRSTSDGELSLGAILAREKTGARLYRIGFVILWKQVQPGA